MNIKLLHLYYDIMNLYGDYGNCVILKKHLEDQGFTVTLDKKTIGDSINFDDYSFIFIGSGTERNLDKVMDDLKRYGDGLKKYIDDKKILLATGNSFEMFGSKIDEKSGLNLFDFEVKRDKDRTTSDVSSVLNYSVDEVELKNGDAQIAETVKIPYSLSNSVEWKYNNELKVYERYTKGKPELDFDTEEQVTAKNIIIESAIFDSVKVRLTSKKILRSEASNRFEKGLDPKRTYMAILRSCHLLEKYADATIVGGMVEYNKLDMSDKEIKVSIDKINSVLGIIISKEEILDIFRRLAFNAVENNGIINFQLQTAQNITVAGLLINSVIDIQELNHDGYHVSMKAIEGTTEVPLVQGDSYTVNMITENKDIKVYNTPGVELPETGGIGTLIYIVVGLSMVLASTVLSIAFIRSSKKSI